jgi:hypothetical protein
VTDIRAATHELRNDLQARISHPDDPEVAVFPASSMKDYT